MTFTYTSPVAQLLTYGKCEHDNRGTSWSDYLSLGFDETHIPDLIRMSSDYDLYDGDENSLKIWAPVHAWRALGQLHAKEAIDPLLDMFAGAYWNDWICEEIPAVMCLIGPTTLPALECFLSNENIDEMQRISMPDCFKKIAKAYPETYQHCVDVLVTQLEKYDINAPVLNAFIISGLVDLNVTETLGLIRTVHAKNRVDIGVSGDIEDVEISMGVRSERSTPKPDYHPGPKLKLDQFDDEFPPSPKRKVGRNDRCPCGSGKKFKKCCLH